MYARSEQGFKSEEPGSSLMLFSKRHRTTYAKNGDTTSLGQKVLVCIYMSVVKELGMNG